MERRKRGRGDKHSLELVAMIKGHVTRENCYTWQRCIYSVSGRMDYEYGAMMVRY